MRSKTLKEGSWYHSKLPLHTKVQRPSRHAIIRRLRTERVSRSSLENWPTHLEYLSQGRYREVVAFRYLFKTTALQKLFLLRTARSCRCKRFMLQL